MSQKMPQKVNGLKGMYDIEDTEESESQLLQRLTGSCVILKPFHHTCSGKDGIWRTPYFSQPNLERHSQFKWYRPKTDRKTLIESTSKYQAEMLQKLLKDKEREMRLLAKQVMKFNKEKFTLLQELEGYRGKAYDDLYRENLILKGQVEGTSKENVILAGKIRQYENRVLQKRKQRRDSK